jgi:protein-L-isoaspartate(D-aspartate) O-methyltransferase
LDVGCGSGVLVAYMARFMDASFTKVGDKGGSVGTVVGIDRVPELVRLSIDNLIDDGLVPNESSIELGERPSRAHLIIREGDGWNGAADLGPFDAIHVGAAPPFLPEALLRQLKPGGRMIIPVGPPRGTWQEWRCIDRSIKSAASDETTSEISSSIISAVRFVPLKGGIGPN